MLHGRHLAEVLILLPPLRQVWLGKYLVVLELWLLGEVRMNKQDPAFICTA